MTDLLNVSLSKVEQYPSQFFLDDAQTFLNLNNIAYSRTSASTTQFILPLELLISCSENKVFYQYFLSVSITYANCVVNMMAQLYHESGVLVKASSVHQKTLLIKFAMARNQKNGKIQIKIQPLTGAVMLSFNFWTVEGVEGSQVIRQLLNNLENTTEIISNILEVLEEIPAEQQNNNFHTSLLSKLHVVRPLIINAKTYELFSETEQQILHQNYFSFNGHPNCSQLSFVNYNLLQKIKKTYVEEFLSMLVHNSSKTKQFNLAYMNLDPNQSMQTLLKNVEHDNILPEGDSAQGKFQSEGKSVRLQYRQMNQKDINYHYSTLDKITKKKLYYSFLKQYVLIPNNLKITGKYVLLKVEDEPPQNLRYYLNKNKISMSFESKLRIISQILAISSICLERTDNFSASFNLTNFSIDKNFEFKLNNLSKCVYHPKMTILQTMYQVLLNKQYYFFKSSQLIVNKTKSIQNINLKHYGPSPMMKLLIKCMQNLEKGIQQNTETNKKQHQNLLLISNKFLNEYEKAMESMSNHIESSLL